MFAEQNITERDGWLSAYLLSKQNIHFDVLGFESFFRLIINPSEYLECPYKNESESRISLSNGA